jgi:hypothetical protein
MANVRAALMPSASATRPIASPPTITGGMSDGSMPGSPSGGIPWGTSPTVATPCADRSSQLETAIEATRTSSDHGTRGSSAVPPNSTTRHTRPTIAVVGVASPRCESSPHTRASTSPDSGGIPSRLGSSPSTMSSTRPNTKPVMIGRDRNSTAQPTRATPPITSPIPAAMARAEVRATAREMLPPDSPATSDPERTETVETGPTTRCGEDPSTA